MKREKLLNTPVKELTQEQLKKGIKTMQKDLENHREGGTA